MVSFVTDAAAWPLDVDRLLSDMGDLRDLTDGDADGADADQVETEAVPLPVRRRILSPAAIEEIVRLLAARGIVEANSRVVDLGARIPHFADRLGVATGDKARPGPAAPSVTVTSGCVLGSLGAAQVDAVIAVDCFPLINRFGGGLAARVVGEAARVLRPGGHLVIVDYSDRCDTALDCYDLVDASVPHGLLVVELAERPLRASDGVLFHLRKAMR